VTSGGNSVRHTGQNLENVIGGSGNDAFTLTGTQALNLNGSGGDDRFVFTDGAALAGTIDGGAGGGDTLDFRASLTGLVVQLTGASGSDGFAGFSTGTLGAFTQINAILGSQTNNDLLIGAEPASTWTVDGTNTYASSGNTLDFAGFETLTGGSGVDRFDILGSQAVNLNGGAGDDLFVFADNAVLTGNIDGGSGSDLVTFAAYTTARRIVLQGYASEDGFIGLDASPAPAILGLFSHINQLIGSSDLVDPDILVGLNQAALWTLGVVNTYQVNPTLTFSSFETLMGGTGVDQFNVTGSQEATLIGGAGDDLFTLNNNAQVAVINGQGGYDTILYKNFTIPVVYDRLNGTATGVASGFSSIEAFGIWQPEPPVVVIPEVVAVLEPVFGPVHHRPAVVELGLLVIRVKSQQLTNITCLDCTGVILRLPEGNQVYFGLWNGTEASLTYLTGSTGLPQGYSLVYSLQVELFRGGNRVLKTDTALQVSFVIPACLKSRELAIFFWDVTLNNGAGGWVKISSSFLKASLSGDFDRLQTWTYHTGTYLLAVQGAVDCGGENFYVEPPVFQDLPSFR
jgi:hypothetical protein